MDFTYGSAFSVDSPDAYETLILDALLGDASLFTRADEVEGAWAIVTPIIEAGPSEPPPEFPNYEAGTWGPEAADELLARDGRRWRTDLSDALAHRGRSPPASRCVPRRARCLALASRARARSIDGIEQELARIWAQPDLHPDGRRRRTQPSATSRPGPA